MAGLTKLNEFMTQLLPILLRGQMDEKRVKLYLDRTIKELRERGEIRSKEAAEDFRRKVLLQIIETGQSGVKDKDAPLPALLENLQKFGIKDPAIPTVPTGTYEQAAAPYADIQSIFAGAMKDVKAPTEEEFSWATRILGSKPVAEFQKEFEKKSAGKTQTELDRDKLTLGEGRLSLDEERFKQEQVEFALTGTKGDVNKENLARYALLKKEETTLKAQRSGLKEEWEDEYDEGKAKALDAKIEKVQKEMLDLVDTMLTERLSTEKLNKIVQRLKADGSTVYAIEKNKEAFMASQGLTDIEYEYIISRIEK